MITVNSISGGKTSAYISANYKADYNIFALVRTNDKTCMFPDKKLRQVVSDRIGTEFIGTLEMNEIIFTILDLEQFIGQEIIWVSGMPFEDLLKQPENNLLPSKIRRYCTKTLKNLPIFYWWLDKIQPNFIETRIGFRANELNRRTNVLNKLNENGLLEEKYKIGKRKDGKNKWKVQEYSKPRFPLIEDKIFKDTIENYWSDKDVRFAELNNCVGCFHRNVILLRKLWDTHTNKMQFFSNLEKDRKYNNDTLKTEQHITYEKIKNYKMQTSLNFDDFSECDSGYCGI